MGEIKNPFSFGTGDIDKDQWLRDIDNELEEFITRYGNATNKHRTALLRLAFQDLRTRIANGDMLNRTADGLYQFSSALNRDDKHMQEAYQRALGFMGGLARRQINTPAPEPEKKSVGNIEERWIKSLNPSGNYNKTAYWKNQTDEERRNNLKTFLNNELTKVNNHEYNDYGGFTDEATLTNRLKSVLTALESQKANDWTLQQLGFTKNWLQQPEEEKEEEAPKTEEDKLNEQLAEQQHQQKVDALKLQVLLGNNATVAAPIYFNLPKYSYNSALDKFIRESNDDSAVWYRNTRDAGKYAASNTGNTSPFDADTLTKAYNGAKKAFTDLERKSLDNYFSNLGVNYTSVYNDKDKQGEFLTNLSRLFTNNGSTYLDLIAKYLTPIGNGKFYINGSLSQGGHYSYFMPKSFNQGQAGIFDASLGRQKDQNEYLLGMYDELYSYKEGGVIKFLEGGISGDEYNKYIKPYAKALTPELNKLQASSEQPNSSFSNSENARIAATIADIASMGAAFVPGYGTAASAVLGLGSTATNFGADLADGQGLWNATKNAGFGLAADVMGLIPGLGGAGKGAKIARNLMWAVPKMMQWVNTANGLANAGEIKNSIVKLTSPSSMTVQDWQNISQALQIMTGHGRSVATKVKKAGMSKTTTTTEPEHYIFTNKGKQKVSDETFKRLREARGTKARQALTLELMGEGVTLLQTRFAPWNTSTRFGAFKEVPGRTTVEVQNKHKGWFSDENLVEKAENANPSVDIRGILTRINPYKAYYSVRNQSVMPQRNYSSFEARLNGETSPLNVKGPLQPYPTGETYATPKTKRKPLTDQQKAARKQKAADKKSKEQAKKQLEELKRSQGYALAEEIPQAGTYADIQLRQQTIANLNSRYANEVELPIPTPRPAPGPRSDAFNKKYGRAIGKKEIGGILHSLRNGGIIKAQVGIPNGFPGLASTYNSFSDWGTFNWGTGDNMNFRGYLEAGKNKRNTINWSLGLYGDTSETNYGNLTMQSAFDALLNYYNQNEGKNIMGDVKSYYLNWIKNNAGKDVNAFILDYNSKVDRLRELNKTKSNSTANSTGWKEFNELHHLLYPSYGLLSNGQDDWDDSLIDILGESTWRRVPNTFKNMSDLQDKRFATMVDGDPKWQVAMDNQGHLIVDNTVNDIKEVSSGKNDKKGDKAVVDALSGIDTKTTSELKNPYDPSLGLIASKVGLGILGNKNIYGNLLSEMPQAPLRDPIDRKLAIVGWQEQIKQGQNQLADLRNATWMQHGSDQLTNLAGMYETEGKGRDIMNDKYMKDSGRLFETAQKSWNLDNEDTLYNARVADENRRAIADRARMMAQIRAAWRSGDQNILMGGLADAGNWLMKKYQREQDLVDKAKELLLGNLERYADFKLRSNPTYKLLLAKKQAGTLTEADRAKMLEIQMSTMDNLSKEYAEKYYNMYHNSFLGGGYKESLLKDGGKMEIEKLKARGKDNDRYVSMIKDLRLTRRRRRR